MKTHSNEHIGNCAVIFEALGLHTRGVYFDQFVATPDYYLAKVREHLPPLPRQRAVQARLDAIDELQEIEDILTVDLDRKPDVKRNNGAIVEPLHHTAWPRKPRRRTVC